MTSSPPITAHLGAGEVDPGGLLQRVLGVGVLEEVQQVLQQALHRAGAVKVSDRYLGVDISSCSHSISALTADGWSRDRHLS